METETNTAGVSLEGVEENIWLGLKDRQVTMGQEKATYRGAS